MRDFPLKFRVNFEFFRISPQSFSLRFSRLLRYEGVPIIIFPFLKPFGFSSLAQPFAKFHVPDFQFLTRSQLFRIPKSTFQRLNFEFSLTIHPSYQWSSLALGWMENVDQQFFHWDSQANSGTARFESISPSGPIKVKLLASDNQLQRSGGKSWVINSYTTSWGLEGLLDQWRWYRFINHCLFPLP